MDMDMDIDNMDINNYKEIISLYSKIKTLRISSNLEYEYGLYEKNRREFFKYHSIMNMIFKYGGIIYGGFVRDWVEIKLKGNTQPNYDINFDFLSTLVLHGVNDIDVIMTRYGLSKLKKNMIHNGYITKEICTDRYPASIVNGFIHVKYHFIHQFAGGINMDILIEESDTTDTQMIVKYLPSAIDFDVNGLYLERCCHIEDNIRCTNHHINGIGVSSLVDIDVYNIENNILKHKATILTPINDLKNKRSTKLINKGYTFINNNVKVYEEFNVPKLRHIWEHVNDIDDQGIEFDELNVEDILLMD